MKISEILKRNEVTLSFEIFPPKNDSEEIRKIVTASRKVAGLKPDFISVTYGAAGTTKGNTVTVAKNIQEQYGVTAMAHLTCVHATKEDVRLQLEKIRAAGIENILVLRGDKPAHSDEDPFPEYRYASELAQEVRASAPEFCLGGACYPEGHVDSLYRSKDIDFLKVKVEAGCEFLTTQMFFNNEVLYNFLYRLRSKGVEVPVIAGIMPITNVRQVASVSRISGTSIPERFKALVDRFGHDEDAMAQAGVAYATEQIIDLIANDVNHIHLYTMNRPEIAAAIRNNLSSILSVRHADHDAFLAEELYGETVTELF